MKNFTALLVLMLVLSACNTHKLRAHRGNVNYKFAMERQDGYGTMANQSNTWSSQLEEVSGDDRMTDDKNEVRRVVLYNADMTIAVKSTDSIAEYIERKAEQFKGYTTNKSTNDITIRVPKDSLDAVLDYVSGLGRVDRKNVRGNDVTDQYVDMSIRLENAEKARQRYLELLAKAEDVKAALLVEKELERLNGLIDSYKGTLNRFDHLSAYSTVTVNIKEKKKPGVLGYIGLGIYHAVKWLFVRN